VAFSAGEEFVDARGRRRTLRVRWSGYGEPGGQVVLSVWDKGICISSFRLPADAVPSLIALLAERVDSD